jgi:hypothetical protein
VNQAVGVHRDDAAASFGATHATSALGRAAVRRGARTDVVMPIVREAVDSGADDPHRGWPTPLSLGAPSRSDAALQRAPSWKRA